MKKEVIICDRCGEMYEAEQKAIVPSGSNRGVKILYDVRITYQAEGCPDTLGAVCGEGFDLCPTCAGSFFNWLFANDKEVPKQRLEDDE